MNIKCVAVIGKQNNMLYLKNFAPELLPDLSFHFMINVLLDVFEEKSKEKIKDNYVGLLYTFDELAVYGYVTNSNVKFAVVVEITEPGTLTAKENEVKAFMKEFHGIYSQHICNPFYNMNEKRITSANFERSIVRIVSKQSS